MFYRLADVNLGRSREPHLPLFPPDCTKRYKSQNRMDSSKLLMGTILFSLDNFFLNFHQMLSNVFLDVFFAKKTSF